MGTVGDSMLMVFMGFLCQYIFGCPCRPCSLYVFIGLKADELCLLLGLSEVFGTSLKTDGRKYRSLKMLEFEGLTPL